MANRKHLDIFWKGVTDWNTWRLNEPHITPDLSEADLTVESSPEGPDFIGVEFNGANLYQAILTGTKLVMAQLEEADLREAILNEAVLSQANLRRANLLEAELIFTDLSTANLQEANLSDVDLAGADLSQADLTGANFRGAHLWGVNLNGAELANTDFAEATFGHTWLGSVDLSQAKGLEKVRHNGPSSLGIDTVYRSKGRISDDFLRGAGVPDEFITYMASLAVQPIQFYSCFISHSTKDRHFCDRLRADLISNRVRTWYFPDDARWGRSVWGEIDLSIKVYDKLVVVCSKSSLQSGPVLREIERALNREDREGKNILFPIRLDNYVFDGWEHERKDDVLRKVVGDFEGWDQHPGKYDLAFQRLLRALRVEDLRPM